jgi:hypothetical protein
MNVCHVCNHAPMIHASPSLACNLYTRCRDMCSLQTHWLWQCLWPLTISRADISSLVWSAPYLVVPVPDGFCFAHGCIVICLCCASVLSSFLLSACIALRSLDDTLLIVVLVSSSAFACTTKSCSSSTSCWLAFVVALLHMVAVCSLLYLCLYLYPLFRTVVFHYLSVGFCGKLDF